MTDTAPAFDAKSFLKNLSSQPGVYQMYGQDGEILYVGKAKNLKKRVSSYFQKTGLPLKTQALVKRICNIEITIAPSEAEALVLEHNLIKAQKPPFNILLRDDKSYPYIFISSGEDYPKLGFHRGAKKRKGQYFGPFPNAAAVRESLNFLQKTFKVRQCEDATYKNRSRPCLMYQIKRCSGPCVNMISKEAYAEDLSEIQLFLEGKNAQLKNTLGKKMEEAAGELEYEKAAEFRDRLAALQHIQAEQSIEAGMGNMDVIACWRENAASCVHVIYVRSGRIMGSRSYFPSDKLESEEQEVLQSFIAQKYLGGQSFDVPSELVVNHAPEHDSALIEAIQEQRGSNIKISSNVRTYKAKWLAMAVEAARQNLQQKLNSQMTLDKRYQALADVLGLDEPPARMECFDISHSSGESTVASCVVFDSQGPKKSDYRRFNIEDINAGDDYAAMHQALNRRYTRLQKEDKALPELLIIDGGKGQLSQAREVLAELGIHSVMLIGVAKGPTRKAGLELLHFEDGRELDLPGDHPALHLIQFIRDEAHRFAVSSHVQARDKKRRRSRLEDVPGVGASRRKALLTHFGGLGEVMKASQAELAKVPGISKKLAEEVYSVLHSE
ncbi:excinuclease ABC subunit UvrC [Agaribacterium haliotis]|uniref:excinuclease ABC subunit UvrC n=1 Tax=Agaribacterium haliotis TaxID=2013869 RepID=UPI000BB589AE|nr:excinuclease ABC subunit UvrC [Agaribacterium haliotis]